MSRRKDAVLQFDAIAIEGGLLPAEWLAKVAALQAPHQAPTDYGVPKGLNLRDELGRYWRIAEAHWNDFAAAREGVADTRLLTQRFVTQLLREVFGATDITASVEQKTLGDRSYPITALACGGRLPLVIAPHGQRLEDRDRHFGDGGRQRSGFGLLQDYLNAAETALWGMASNGLLLRLARDNASLTRPAWVEADLERIFTEQRFADFSLLWLLIHASRFGNSDATPQQCALEAWYAASREQGTRAREQLRAGVEEALKILGQGFLSEATNDVLRWRLASGELTPDGYFQQLLRLVYRFIFLLTIEERGLLHPEQADPEAVRLYQDGYSLRRLRERARRRRAWDRHADLWQGIKPVFTGLTSGQPLLALPALGGLFAADQCPDLDDAELGNSALLTAVHKLAWMHDGNNLTRINWRDMGPEELGSVYESLLELVPQVAQDGRVFRFANAEQSQGNARKTSGSYYTPDPLVQELLDSALEPVIRQRIAGATDPQAALLSITICDPACGSGHFLLAAARRLANHLAQLRAQGTPSGSDYRRALRDVICHCIYGVDLNPLALELARMSLWLEAMTPEKPLGFLDHHLQCGDALLGVLDPAILDQGLPDAAFALLSVDDKAVASELKKQNKRERESWKRALSSSDLFRQEQLAARTGKVEQLADDNLDQVAAKEAEWKMARGVAQQSRLARLADLYLGAFLLPKLHNQFVPSSRHLWAIANDEDEPILPEVEAAARGACAEARVLHWWVAFPHIAAQGGFAVMLGNPPWERIKLQEEEFFASRNTDIANAKNKAERSQRIKWLSEGVLARHLLPSGNYAEQACDTERRLHREFITARRNAEAASAFAHVKSSDGGRYPLTGVGDVNTYALFAETFAQLVQRQGQAGLIVPTGIATDDSTKAFFSSISQSGRLVSLFDFENREGVFPDVDSRQKFCLLTLGQADAARFVYFATQVNQLADNRRQFTLSPQEFALINPNTRTCPVFRSLRDTQLTKKFYSQAPVLIREAQLNGDGNILIPENNPWGIRFQTMFHMSNDSHLFRDSDGAGRLPLYEAKMIHQFDHRWASYVDVPGSKDGVATMDVTEAQKAEPTFTVKPRYWVGERDVLARIARVPRAVSKTWLALHEASETDDRRLAADALWLALTQWIAGELWRREAGSSEANGCYSDAQKIRAAKHVEARIANDYAACDAVLRDAGIRGKKAITEFAKWAMQDSDIPLSDDELATLQRLAAQSRSETRDRAAHAELDSWMDCRSPGWLMGWRDICRATDERTVIASVFPRVAVGNKIPLFFPSANISAPQAAALLANLSSLVLDFVARQKIGGTTLNYFYMKQFPILPPERYTKSDLQFIASRVLELTYTAKDMAAWAADLGYAGAPFPWNPERRARLRAELDAYYAHLYGLSEEELRYILDPADVVGEDYPSETFRVLRNNELRDFGEYRETSAASLRLTSVNGERRRDYVQYRTQHLALEAFKRGFRTEEVLHVHRETVDRQVMRRSSLPDSVWARPHQDEGAETGVLLAALLKGVDRPWPIRQIRLAAVLALEPRLMTPLLEGEDASDWQRLIGDEANPLSGAVLSFISRANHAWGRAVHFLRSGGYLVEDLGSGNWAKGYELDIPVAEWADGRVQMVLAFLQKRRQDFDGVIRELPTEIGGWIDAAAA
ncbi:Probable type I restriction enzyme BthVORF4518P M protein [Burkholderia pseudomallei]|uniref:Eco57I restriction-modification methylase domain-containing protein n=1 Tax=Burkholderia pseudomallei TaxID=28450 RepID=UPI0005E5D9D6|nr:DNA methyltransferase [Burkholderia pseudomallei]CFU05103.1 Probable type I restriction enzyme BthVORF4518P M protein [Burkholderia pseudomallei]CPI04652.1 Probable type I restriction enzyme BthVORF4518P M protein [Burkholderia pseudomallei]